MISANITLKGIFNFCIAFDGKKKATRVATEEDIKKVVIEWLRDEISRMHHSDKRLQPLMMRCIERWKKRFNVTYEELRGE